MEGKAQGEGKAQEVREQTEAKLREEREKASQRFGRSGDKGDDKARQEMLRQQQAEQDRRDTFDENFEV